VSHPMMLDARWTLERRDGTTVLSIHKPWHPTTSPGEPDTGRCWRSHGAQYGSGGFA
jgi:hypothetical protein